MQVKEISNDKFSSEKLHYINNVENIFPQDLNIEYPIFHYKKLRPEYIFNYSKNLNSDSFITKNSIDSQDLIDAVENLKINAINSFVNQINSLEIIPQDSFTFTQVIIFLLVNIFFIIDAT